MRMIKDCALRIKGQCKKTEQYCSFLPNAPLTTCTILGVPEKKKTKGRKKR